LDTTPGGSVRGRLAVRASGPIITHLRLVFLALTELVIATALLRHGFTIKPLDVGDHVFLDDSVGSQSVTKQAVDDERLIFVGLSDTRRVEGSFCAMTAGLWLGLWLA
jgi:hypothetical protein